MDEEKKPFIEEEEEFDIIKKINELNLPPLEEFCAELDLMLHVCFGGRIYRKDNELKIYLRKKQLQFRIVVEPIPKKK